MTPGRTRRRGSGDPLQDLLEVLRLLDTGQQHARETIERARSSPVHARLAAAALRSLRAATVETVRVSGEALRVLERISRNAEGGQ